MSKKIVLIEDDEILSKVIFEELKEAGFTLFQAFDGEDGLKLVREEHPDLVLLDVLMPKMDGFATLDAIKKDPTTRSIPVIMLTMLGSDDDIKRGLQLGANDYIVKSQHAVGEIIEKVKDFFAKESHPEGTVAQPIVPAPSSQPVQPSAPATPAPAPSPTPPVQPAPAIPPAPATPTAPPPITTPTPAPTPETPSVPPVSSPTQPPTPQPEQQNPGTDQPQGS